MIMSSSKRAPTVNTNLIRFCATVLLLLPSFASSLKVFVLAGQSNMVGEGSIKHLDILCNVPNTSSTSRNEYREALWDDALSSYKSRDDVFVKYTSIPPLSHGNLTVARNSGFAGRNAFGPEVMFGWTIGDYLKNEKVLLIKTAWGGKTLAIDFRSPSAGTGNYSSVKPIEYGVYYRAMISDILDTLNKLPEFVPGFKVGDKYDLEGFVWFQGWNDMLMTAEVEEYAANLALFIRDVRADLGHPTLPFIAGELGMHGLHPEGSGKDRVLKMRAAQKKVTLLEEFHNTTLYVRTAPFAILDGDSYNGIYHYNGRADTYFHIGKAFGESMIKLFREKRPNPSVSVKGRRLGKA